MLHHSLLIRHWLTERAVCANRSTILDKLLHLLSTCKDREQFALGGCLVTRASALRIWPRPASFGTAGSTGGAEPLPAMQQVECCCAKRSRGGRAFRKPTSRAAAEPCASGRSAVLPGIRRLRLRPPMRMRFIASGRQNPPGSAEFRQPRVLANAERLEGRLSPAAC